MNDEFADLLSPGPVILLDQIRFNETFIHSYYLERSVSCDGDELL